MFLSTSIGAALDRIEERANDVRRAYTPGAQPQHDDVALPDSVKDFTLDPLSVAAPDGAYFVVRSDNEGRAYTRDGSFMLRGGSLVDAAGRPILGERRSNESLGELSIDPVDATLGRVRNPAVDADGTFSYHRLTVDPRSGVSELQRVVVGRVALVRVPAGTRLEMNRAGDCTAPAGVALPTGLPGDGSFGRLLPQHRERSRIDIDESVARLKEAYMAFDALATAEKARVNLGKTAMNLVK